MEAFLLIAWILFGVAGGALMWWDYMVDVERSRRACPTPRAILVILLLSPLGGVILASGALITLIRWLGRIDWSGSWWTRPLCGRDD